MILGIDPGNVMSAYVLLGEDFEITAFNKVENEILLDAIHKNMFGWIDEVAIEMIGNFGMAVGKTVFDTCVFIGQLREAFSNADNPKVSYIYRKDEKMNLCNSMRAKDTNIRQALIDRFGIVGVKANKGYFYGFKADMWSAMAVAVTYIDLKKVE